MSNARGRDDVCGGGGAASRPTHVARGGAEETSRGAVRRGLLYVAALGAAHPVVEGGTILYSCVSFDAPDPDDDDESPVVVET